MDQRQSPCRTQYAALGVPVRDRRVAGLRRPAGRHPDRVAPLHHTVSGWSRSPATARCSPWTWLARLSQPLEVHGVASMAIALVTWHRMSTLPATASCCAHTRCSA